MASEELSKKLQSRFTAVEVPAQAQSQAEAQEPGPAQVPVLEPGPESEQSPVRAKTRDPEPNNDDSSSELCAKLTRRQDINDGTAAPRLTRVFNPYTEFKEFSRKQIKDMEAMFKRYDTGRDGFIDLMELKLMMEKLGAPQTHLGLKNMIKEVDEDFDGKLSYREFLLIFRRAAAGELQEESGLMALARLSEIDVSTEGVMGAKDFFEAKMQALSVGSKFEAEIREEKEERKRQEVEKKQRQAAFKQLQSAFCS
ncbi:EF-hand domain-containing protein D1 [Genypterus blacodes]|uniref:EF-hand domain-containing protein D1 n=1 Tax=Genypterus blacodes TaxID=154954 RepID=UPI003F7655B3